jgi:hypothetical protein
MKVFVLLSLMSTILISSSDCNPKKANNDKYKGKLEIAGICMNYTIRVVEGNVEASLIDANWTDETTKKAYTNVFRLGNPCQFPSTIKQGDEFYFTIDTSQTKPCTVCMAYYPTPSKAISIKVLDN